MSEKQVRDYDKFMLRFPDGMRDAIAERAKANGRSMNSEIIQIIQDALHVYTDEELNAIATELKSEGSKDTVELPMKFVDDFIKQMESLGLVKKL